MTTISPLLRVKERIKGPSGIFNIQNEWYGYLDEFKYTIGLPGLMGFGVGCCPPDALPFDISPLPGTEDIFSPNYGTYIHIPSASIICFVPAHYIDVEAQGDTNAPYYGTKITISDTQSGNAVLARPFTDGGSSLIGVFIDKYQGSNCKPDGSGQANNTSGPGGTPLTGGIFASRPLHWPVSPITKDNGGTDFNSPFSLCNSTALNGSATTPSDNLGGVWALCQTRGSDFLPCPIWTYTQIGFLSLAHAQALLNTSGVPISGATNNAAWMDVAPYAPKGNNNNGADSQKTSLAFARTDLTGANASGFAGRNSRAFTGAARISGVSAVEHTTHNGQLSGIVDVNGNQWGIAPGLTSVTSAMSAGGYRLLPSSVAWSTISSNSDIRSASGLISLAAESSPGADDGIWHTAANAYAYLQPDVDGTFHEDLANASTTLRAMTECGIPREDGTTNTQGSTGVNIYGGDGFYRSLTADCLPRVGGYWGDGSRAGVFIRRFNGTPSSTSSSIGARAVRLLSA